MDRESLARPDVRDPRSSDVRVGLPASRSPQPVAGAATPAPAAANGQAFLRIESLKKSYGPTVALDDLSLDVHEGEFFCLLGPSGCGKSTILGIVAGLLEPTSGDLRLKGVPLRGTSINQRNVGYVFQDYALFPHMSAYENVAYGLRARKAKPDYIKKRVAELLELVRLVPHAHRVPSQLSGGQQQRVAVARALAVDPTILLLDEPLSNLDAQLRLAMQVELARIHRETGLTTILVTHDREEAFALADRIALLRDGRLQQVGTPVELYSRPVSRFSAEFMGRANFLDVAVDPNGSLRALAADGAAVRLPAPPDATLPVGAKGTLMVRPEAVVIVENESDADDGAAFLEGDIVSRSFRGSFILLEIDTGFATVQVEIRPEVAPTPTTSHVGLRWHASASLLVSG